MSYWILKAFLTPVLRLLYRVRVEGAEHLPASGPVLLAANHRSFCDSIFLPLVVPRRVTYIAKAEYFESWRTAWFFRALGQIPMSRGGGSASERALDAARRVLGAGGLLGIYPEGTRSPDGRLHKGHTGVARLALDCRAPVVAVGMTGTAEVQPVGEMRPRPFLSVTVRLSKPLSFEHHRDRPDDPLALRQVTDEIMFEVAQLSGQQYVDRYASRTSALTDGEEAHVVAVEPVPDPALVTAGG